MARKATKEGTLRRLELLRTAVENLERDLTALGEDVKPYAVYTPDVEIVAVGDIESGEPVSSSEFEELAKGVKA